MKKLPIGVSSFSEIITGNYVYVDKTALIQRMIEQGRYYFLSRPRRMGKSLLVNTLKELFAGNEALFRGLHLHSQYDWNEQHPVIRLTFAQSNMADVADLVVRIQTQFNYLAQEHQLTLPQVHIREQFEWLLRTLTERYGRQVVVLIDEYDKPILDRLEQPEQALALREALKDFYAVLKDNDAWLRFVLLTGVSKFSQVSLFSGLNTLEDITINAQYSALCGYTQSELEHYFADYLGDVDKTKMRLWYNGYSWLGESVYNPYDVLLFLKDRQYRSYWFATATPGFLLKLLKEGAYYLPEMEQFTVSETSLSSFDLDNIPAEVLLFQTGYLTIRKSLQMGQQLGFELGYPNLEVKLSLNTHLLNYLTPNNSRATRISGQIYQLLENADLSALQRLFERFFASIPHDWYRNNNIDQYEGYYASVFYAHMVTSGALTIPEDVMSSGQIDLSVIVNDKVFIFEFKVTGHDRSDGRALAQIQSKAYADKYRDERQCYLVGIEFSRTRRNIVAFNWVKQ